MTPSSPDLPKPLAEAQSPGARLKAIFDGLAPLFRSTGMAASERRINRLFGRLSDHSVSILVCGEFKLGKSSLVNALAGREFCPVNDSITTSAISLIRYGAEEKAVRQFSLPDNRVQKEEVPFSLLGNFAKGSPAENGNTIILEIEAPEDNLKSGLCIIDTPGIGGLDERHLALTSFALTRADAVIFVTDANQPLTASELKFFKENIAPLSRNIKIVVNKIDTVPAEDIPSIVKDVKDKIKTACGQLSAEVIPLSVYNMQLYTMTGEESFLRDSNMEALLKGIREMRSAFRSALLGKIKTAIIEEAGKLKTKLKEEEETIAAKHTDALNRLQEEGQALVAQKKEIENPSSKFNRDLTAIIDNVQTDVTTALTNESILLSSQKLDELLGTRIPSNYDRGAFVLASLNRELNRIATSLNRSIDKGFAEVMEKARVSFEQDAGDYSTQISTKDLGPSKKLSEKIFSNARNGMVGLGVFSATSLIGGLVASSTIVMPIAAVGGIIMAYKSISIASKAATKQELMRQIQPRITIAVNELRAYIQSRFKEFSRTLREALLESAQQMEAQLAELKNSLESYKQKLQQSAVRKANIEKQSAFIDSSVSQLNLLLRNPFAIPVANPHG